MAEGGRTVMIVEVTVKNGTDDYDVIRRMEYNGVADVEKDYDGLHEFLINYVK